MVGTSITRIVSTIIALLLGILTDLCEGGSYCLYLHEDHYTFNQKYCENGCCEDYGDEDEICCFSWTVGIIIGICFACVGFIALAVFVIICCYTMKKRSRTGQVINPAPAPPQNNMVVYTAAPAYAYPHPPSAFYPGSRFPGHAIAPPPYTAGTQPAYPPTYTGQDAPPPPVGLYGPSQGSQPSAPSGHFKGSNQEQPYGGYGTGNS